MRGATDISKRPDALQRPVPDKKPQKLITLRKRADFLRAAKCLHAASPTLIVQMRRRDPGEATGPRVGFTCSKKVGNAVVRNRAKRRLREAARSVLQPVAKDTCDYVLIGRAGKTVCGPFSQLEVDLSRALAKLHRHVQ